MRMYGIVHNFLCLSIHVIVVFALFGTSLSEKSPGIRKLSSVLKIRIGFDFSIETVILKALVEQQRKK